jgi:hypothetical protein
VSGPIIVRRAGLGDELLDVLVELATETVKRRDMHRRAGRTVPDLPNEDTIRRFLLEHRRQRGLQDYELSERRDA